MDFSTISTVAGVAGVVVVVVVLWLLRNELRIHYHKCPKCAHIWKHRGIIAMWQSKSHSCPKCGTEEYWKFDGTDP